MPVPARAPSLSFFELDAGADVADGTGADVDGRGAAALYGQYEPILRYSFTHSPDMATNRSKSSLPPSCRLRKVRV
jgi:hypothetical protein